MEEDKVDTLSSDNGHSNKDFIIGLILAISSSLFIGSSFIIKKKGLLRVARSSSTRAGSGGFAYLREWLWWAGLLTMAVGEASNFAAFGFVPASLVTTLGALSVLIAAVLASVMLNERLNIHGKLGCILAIIGSTVVVIHSPESPGVDNLYETGKNMLSPLFILYAGSAVSLAIYLIFWKSPKIGQTNVLVYVSICSLLGSLSVVFAKGLSIAIRLTASGNSQLLNPLAWFFLIAMATGITIQLSYLNMALDTFNTALVTPIYYVMFTTLSITSSGILYKEWTKLSIANVAGDLCGFATTICGVFLLHMFKDVNVTFSDLLSSSNKTKTSSNEPELQPSLNSPTRTLDDSATV
ncbi:magnesium transporter NIPA2-like [Halichondria panicea]|uniref:magnesium transporter NIPA2-like n=1 Tax=Halichondria panicea TaxID=6063 RepID=UPI00312B7174